MKQRVIIQAIIRKDGKTLLLRRAVDSMSAAASKYELPGGRLEYGEQPDDALKRHVHEATGQTVQASQLFDVLTYVDHDDRDVQSVYVFYLVSLVAGGSKIRLGDKYVRYLWEKVGEAVHEEMTEVTKLVLGISQHGIRSSIIENKLNDDINTSSANHVIAYSDGGSRGNPGPSSAGFILMDTYDHVLSQGGVYLGITTNNQAEYQGVKLGLEKALEIGARTVDFRIDSLLVVNQMNGVYKIKNRELWPIHERIRELVAQFDKVTFSHVKREFNQLADGVVNKILNERSPR